MHTHEVRMCYTRVGLRLRACPASLAAPMNADLLLQNLDAFVGFVRKRTGDPHLAADLVQECLLKALRSDHPPVEDEGVIPWFYRILRHAVIDAHRRRSTRETALAAYGQEWPESIRPEEQRDICECVMRLLPDMPEAEAELLRRVDLEGESPTQIAEARNERVNTLNVRLHRSRRHLRESLEKVCRGCAKHGCVDCDCAG
jgi:RNA polymerase sigma factor (sigma-70 family)